MFNNTLYFSSRVNIDFIQPRKSPLVGNLTINQLETNKQIWTGLSQAHAQAQFSLLVEAD